MNDKLNSAFMDDPEFQSLMVDCMESLQRGESIDRDVLRKKFPRYADDLDRYLDVLNVLDRFAGGLPQLNSSGEPSSPYEATVTPHTVNRDLDSTETIRYIGEYEVLEEIARGGMGVVFKARQQTLRRTVALKMILSGRLADTVEINRFRREAQAASRLQHPNIVSVHEIGEHDGRQYFTMDYVEGHSLADEIREESMAPQRAASLVQIVAEAVQFAHEKGTLHRDLKPANILLTTDDSPHVTDFGLAKILDEVDEESRAELTASGQILGTPSYMSPEQAAGKQNLVGPASDIYSLGAILYACLTGRAPFVADSPVDTLMQVIHQEPVSPRQLNPAVPVDLETICLKCLNKEPGKRYESPQELADDLERFLEGRPVLARPVGSIERGWRWTKRNPVVATLLLLVGFLLVAGTTVSSILAVSEHSQRLIAEQAKSDAIEASEEAQAERDAAQYARNVAEQRGEDLRRQLYVAHMNQAMAAWTNDNVRRVHELLAEHVPSDGEPDFRGFEWYYLSRLANSHVSLIQTGDDKLHAIACSPDGRLIASGGPSKVEIWNAETREIVTRLDTRLGYQGDLEFSLDGSRLVTGSFDHRTVQVWDTQTFELLQTIRTEHAIRQLSITPGNETVVSSHFDYNNDQSFISLVNLASGDVRTIGSMGHLYAIAVRPDGRVLAGSSEDSEMLFWDLRTGKSLSSWRCPFMTSGIAFSPDGQQMAVSGNNRSVEIRNTETGETLHTWRNLKGVVMKLEFHPNGRLLAGGSGATTVHLFDTETGEQLLDIRGHESPVVDVGFRPGTHLIASAEQNGIIKEWDFRSEPETNLTVESHWVPDVCFSRRGDLLALASGIPWERDQPGQIEILNARTGEAVAILKGHQGGVFGVSLREDGRQLASAGADGKVILWDIDSGTEIHSFETDATVTSVILSEDGRIVAAGIQGGVRVWDVTERQLLKSLSLPGNQVEKVVLSLDGRMIAGCNSTHYAVWTLDGGVILEGKHSREEWAHGIAFSPDGTTFVTANVERLEFYNLSTRKLTADIPAHSQRIFSLAYFPDGERLVTKTHFGEIKIWDTKSHQSLLTLPSVEPGGWNAENVAVSPDGDWIVAGHDAQGLLIHSARASNTNLDDLKDSTYWADVGRQQVAYNQWESACENYQRALRSSNDVRLHIDASACAILSNKDEVYRQIVRKGIENLAEDDGGTDAVLGGQFARMAALREGVVDDLEMLRQLAERSWIENRPGPAILYVLLRMHEYEELLENTETLLQPGGSDRTSTLLFRAIALYRLGRISEANQSLAAGMSLIDRAYRRTTSGQFPFPLNMYASIEVLRKEADTIALETLDKAIGNSSSDPTLYAVRGDLHRRWRRWDQATADFRRAVDLQPGSMDYLKAAAVTALLAGDAGERQKQDCLAIRELLRQPEWINNAWSAGRHISLAPHLIEDEELLRMVRVQANKRNWWNQIALVAVLHRMERSDEALKFLGTMQPANQDWREHALTLLWQSLLLASLGEQEDARTAFDEAELMIEENLLPPGVTTTADEVLILREEASSRLVGLQHENRRVEQERASDSDETDKPSDRDPMKELNQPLEVQPQERSETDGQTRDVQNEDSQ